MRIFVLGGAGKMGCISVQALAKDERVDEIINADINVDQAQTVADYLDSPKIKIKKVVFWVKSLSRLLLIQHPTGHCLLKKPGN